MAECAGGGAWPGSLLAPGDRRLGGGLDRWWPGDTCDRKEGAGLVLYWPALSPGDTRWG